MGAKGKRVAHPRATAQVAEIDAGISPHARLVLAILELALRDAIDGDPIAIRWLDSRMFDHYCTWLSIEPAYIRRLMEAKIAEGTRTFLRGQRGRIITEPELDHAVSLYRRGCSYVQIARGLGISVDKATRLIESAQAAALSAWNDNPTRQDNP